MSSPPPLRREPGFGDPRDKQFYARVLRLIGLGGASFFADASRILSSDPPFQAAAHLIGHCLRELDGSIRQALAPVKVQPANQAEEAKDREKQSESHRKDIEAILRSLDLDLDGKIGKAWLNVVGIEGSLGFVGIAHRRGLSTPRPIDASIRSLWEDYRSVLDAVLDRFEARFLPVTGVLDQLLASNSPIGRDAVRGEG